MMPKTTTVAVVSRHHLFIDQRQSLVNAGYRYFVQVTPPPEREALTGGRFRGVNEVWWTICHVCDGVPGLVVAVLPQLMLGQLAVQATEKGVTVLRARMVEKNGGWLWTGEWQQIAGFSLNVRKWTPEPRQQEMP
jgi:hypothetical protein